MMFSLQETFKNIKVFFVLLAVGLLALTVELFHLSQYGERFNALKSQHELINKIINTDLNDPQMAAILINASTAEMQLAVKKTANEALLDLFIIDNNEQATLLESLQQSSEMFRSSALTWSESLQISRQKSYQNMLKTQAPYEHDINALMVYHAQLLDKSINLAKYTVFALFPLSVLLILFFLYRLNQIAYDIKQAGSVDVDGTPKEMKTKEIDFMIKRLSRKSPTSASNVSTALLHPQSGLLNEKGMVNAFNAKRANKTTNSLFVGLFDFDQHHYISQELTKDDQGGIYRKLGEILSLHEQAYDTIAQLDNNRFIFLLSRSSKDTALSDVQKIIDSVKETTFVTSKGTAKFTLSAGFMFKAPVKSLEEMIEETGKLIQLAQESGGNRVTQIRPN